MLVADIIAEQDYVKAHSCTFCLLPQEWEAFNLPDAFDWEIHPFQQEQVEHIPSEPGIYSFVIQPRIAGYPACSYLMYIGKTRRTLRVRFSEYLREQRNPAGRSNILRLLHKYRGYLHFCSTVIPETERIHEIEDALITSFVPPCNEQLPSGVRRVRGVF